MAIKQSFYTVQEFCYNANWSAATQKNYKYALLNYARFLFPKEKDTDKVLVELYQRVRSETDPAKDIAAYANHMKGQPPKTVGLYLTAVRSYYGINGHLFNKQEMKRIVPKTGDAETVQGELTTEILKGMVNAADIRGRVLIMLFASTACRIGELCAVTLDMVDMSSKPACIRLPKEITKNKRKRTVFMTEECKEIVSLWLQSERMKYLTASYYRNEGLNDQFRDKDRMLPDQDNRLLGVSTYGARSIWYTTISRVLTKDKLKPDKKTRIHPLPPHAVRKWWRITANKGFGNEDVAHLIMGHWNNSLDFVYAKMGDAGLGKEFLKAQGALSILSSENVLELQEDAKKQVNKMLALEEDNKKLRARLEHIPTKEEFEKMQADMAPIIKRGKEEREASLKAQVKNIDAATFNKMTNKEQAKFLQSIAAEAVAQTLAQINSQ